MNKQSKTIPITPTHITIWPPACREARLQSAIVQYRQALRINPSDPDFHNNLGIVLKNTGDTAAAENEYRESLKLNPRQAHAHTSLGNLFYQKKDLKSAIAEYREAIRADPSNADHT